MIPVRCFTCNACIAHKYEAFQAQKNESEFYNWLLTSIGVHRLCCRRMLLTHNQTIDDIINFPQKDEVMDEIGTMFLCQVRMSRTVGCA